jgi:hypothetical protein
MKELSPSELGRQLAYRRAKVLSPERRSDIASFAASHPRPNRKKKIDAKK